MSDRAMEILRLALDYARLSTLEDDPVPPWVEEGERLLAEHDAGQRSSLGERCQHQWMREVLAFDHRGGFKLGETICVKCRTIAQLGTPA